MPFEPNSNPSPSGWTSVVIQILYFEYFSIIFNISNIPIFGRVKLYSEYIEELFVSIIITKKKKQNSLFNNLFKIPIFFTVDVCYFFSENVFSV